MPNRARSLALAPVQQRRWAAQPIWWFLTIQKDTQRDQQKEAKQTYERTLPPDWHRSNRLVLPCTGKAAENEPVTRHNRTENQLFSDS